MPIQKTILTDLGLVYSRWQGAIRVDEILSAQLCYASSDAYRPDQTYLVDLSGVEHSDIRIEDMEQVLMLIRTQRAVSESGGGSMRALVLAPDDLTFGLSRQFQAVAEMRGGAKVHVFRDESDLTDQIGMGEASIADMLANTKAVPIGPVH